MSQPNITTRRLGLPVVAMLVLGLFGLAACGHAEGDEPLGYLAKTKNRIVFVEWSASSASPAGFQKLFGSATLALIDRTTYALHTDVAPFTGTLQGTDVSLTLNKALDSATSWKGTLASGKLSLSYTDGTSTVITLNFLPAPRTSLNTAIVLQQQALADLQTNVASGTAEDKQRAAVDKWSKIVAEDIQKLGADADAVTAAVGAVTSANSSADASKAAAHHALTEALKRKYAPQVCPLASESSASANAASGAAASAAAGDQNVTDLSSAVKKDIAKLTSDHGALAAAQAEIPSYKPKGLPTDDAVNTATTSANTAIGAAAHTSNGAARAAGTKASTAQGYASQAQAACNAAPSDKPSPTPT
jgi:hypothetical protein